LDLLSPLADGHRNRINHRTTKLRVVVGIGKHTVLWRKKRFRVGAWVTTKNLFILCVIGFVVPHGIAIGAPLGLPTNVCTGSFCGLVQQEIWNRFQTATGLDVGLIPSVYSGSCYHDSPMLDPHLRHFGGLLIDKLDGQVFFDGRFSFYEDKQPYAHLNVETARVRFGARHGMTLLDEFAYAEASDSLKPFRYWFRRDAGGDGLLLVGYFGYQHTILCTLDRHAD
jgi:hypothetical protein